MKCVVTGGGGFVGRALCEELLRRGISVTAVARSSYPELVMRGVELVRIDLGSDEIAPLVRAFEGATAVFHVASKVDMWGKYEDFYRTNVVGTRNVIAACRRAGVPRLIYTSSPSVIANGSNHEGVDESVPYPKTYTAYYPMTKAMAEREVLMANGRDGLATVALRPHLIWGPGDTHLIPTIVSRARAGRLPQIGDGRNLVDVSFIDDCVAAHICAMESIHLNPSCHGKAYFISQGEPVKMWEWIGEILVRSGVPPIKKRLSRFVAMGIARVAELAASVIPWVEEPLLTRFLVSQMSTHHYFSIAAARRDLGYSPAYTVAKGLDRTFPRPTLLNNSTHQTVPGEDFSRPSLV